MSLLAVFRDLHPHMQFLTPHSPSLRQGRPELMWMNMGRMGKRDQGTVYLSSIVPCSQRAQQEKPSLRRQVLAALSGSGICHLHFRM